MIKQRLLTPGPTPVPEETLLELARPMFYHRGSGFRKILLEVTELLQYVFRTTNPVATLTASGTGGMEAALVSSFARGEKVICLISGRWGERWRKIASGLGLEVVAVTVPPGEVVTPEMLAAAMKQHPDAAGVCATLSETATGVKNDVAGYGKIVTASPALLLVDAISGLGCVECRTDEWGVDLCVTGSQKALMLPPGLAFVSASEKARLRFEKNPTDRAFYFDLRKYLANLPAGDTPFTPANTLIRALLVSLRRIKATGLDAMQAAYSRIAAAARAGVEAMGLRLFAKVPAESLTVFAVPAGIDGNELVSRLEARYGIKVAGGQDELKGKIVRLAHMGYIDAFDILAAISAVELTLAGMGFEVEAGAGVAAAQRVLAADVSSQARA